MSDEEKSIIKPNEWLICWSNRDKKIIFGLRESNGDEKEIKLSPKEILKLQEHINHLIRYGIKYNYFKKIRKGIIK